MTEPQATRGAARAHRRPIDNGWRVVNVAPSHEQFEVFAHEQLIPPRNRKETLHQR